nr:hypothetical protein [Sphingomonas melonis]
MDFHTEFVERNPILQVPVESIGFLDQDRLHRGMAFQVGQHGIELGAAGFSGGFDIDMLAGDVDTIQRSIFSKKLQLSRDRKTLTFLLGSGNARIEHSPPPTFCLRLAPLRPRSHFTTGGCHNNHSILQHPHPPAPLRGAT